MVMTMPGSWSTGESLSQYTTKQFTKAHATSNLSTPSSNWEDKASSLQFEWDAHTASACESKLIQAHLPEESETMPGGSGLSHNYHEGLVAQAPKRGRPEGQSLVSERFLNLST